MEIYVSKTKTYIPEWNGNQELPAEEQVVATYRNPDIIMRKRLVPRTAVKFEYNAEGLPTGGSGEISTDPEAVVRGMLISLTNLRCNTDGKVVSITTPDALLSAPAEYYGLVKELADEFGKDLKKEVPEKN